MMYSVALLACVALLVGCGESLRITVDESQVQQYHPYAVTLKSSAHYDNPWTDASVSVSVRRVVIVKGKRKREEKRRKKERRE
jgi:hypothetical protein